MYGRGGLVVWVCGGGDFVYFFERFMMGVGLFRLIDGMIFVWSCRDFVGGEWKCGGIGCWMGVL